MKDAWTIILLLLAVLDDGDSLLELLKSDPKDFDKLYDDLIHTVEDIEAEDMKNKLIELLNKFKDAASNVNEKYKEAQEANNE